jgi:hypothetical protein
MIKTLLNSVADTLGASIDHRSVFAKFERFTAGFCMAIPFYLIVMDQVYKDGDLFLLFLPLIITFAPLLIPVLVRAVESKNIGLWITLAGTITLLGLYFFFVEHRTDVKGSISAYVRMENPQIFGMLLSIAAMLFLASGAVHAEKKRTMNFREGGWRSIVNVIQGIFLLGVVVIPCDTMKNLHLTIALIFFVSCGLSTLVRETKPAKRTQQRIIDFVPVVIMAVAMLIHFAQGWCWLNWKPGPPWSRINLFGAESIALWITGIDFILVSLKGELDPERDDTANKKHVEATS